MAKWRKRTTAADAPMGPKPASTVLPAEEEASAVACRPHTLLPPDECLHALRETIPPLSRSALHRCSQRHGASRLLLSEEGQAAPQKKVQDSLSGDLPVDFAEVRTPGSQVASTSLSLATAPVKVALADLSPRATRMIAADCLRRVPEKLPDKILIVLTGNGVHFILQPHQWFPGGHSFARISPH